MISRTELSSCTRVFDVLLSDEHFYVFGFPIYKTMYVGRHMFPDDEKFYLIPPEVYVKLISLKRVDAQQLTNACQEYLDREVITPILQGAADYTYIGSKSQFEGSEMSIVMQAIVRNVHNL